MASITFNEKRGRWVCRYYDPTGQRGWETLPKGSTKRNAQKRRREIEDQIEKKTFKRPSLIPTFREVAEQWLGAKSSTLRHTTHAQYLGHVKNHLVPSFGNVKCNEVTLELVERFVTHHMESGTHSNTIRKVLTTLGAIMRYASHPKRNYAPYDPTAFIENKPRRLKKEAEMTTLDETLAIIEQMDSERDRLIVLTMAITGMREGEIFGLKWGDIQWKDFQIYVRRTYNHGRFYDPKSERSKRKIDVPQAFLQELKKWKLACPKGALDLVFSNGNGNPIDATNWLKNAWHPARRRAQIRHLTPHALRHFNGSILLDMGETVGFVQDHLGHSQSAITMDVYRHKIRQHNREAAEKLSNLFFGPDGCKMGANRDQEIKKDSRHPT
jgi:integrase